MMRLVATPPSGSAPAILQRTAWARNMAAPVRNFLHTESAGAVALLCATIAALLWANSPWWESYESVWSTELSIRLGSAGISLPLRDWISQGLMTFYFLVVGLEARRDLDLGALRERRRILLVAVTACCGMAGAALIYLAFNAGGDGAHGWGAAMSSDTAFGLGVVALLAPRATRLRLRLLSISVVDDLVALLVIATVYTEQVDVVALGVAFGLFGVLVVLRYAPAEWRTQAAAVVGVGVWVALHESGVDPLISGLAVGLAIAAYPPARPELERVTELARSFREQPTPALARSAQLSVTSAISANERLEYRLHPWTSFVIVPLFALSNIGIHVESELLGDALTSPITLGIVFGYVLGKPLGILLGGWLGSRLLQVKPTLSWPVRVALGTVAGVPFTVSILIAGIAFEGRALEEAKLGVLAAAILTALLSWAVVRAIAILPKELRARQLSRTADDLLDLSEDVDPEARPHSRSRFRSGHPRRVRRLRVSLLRAGGGRDPPAAVGVRRRAALRLATPAAQRCAPKRPDGRRGHGGSGRPGVVLADARQAADDPGRAHAARPKRIRAGLDLDVDRFTNDLRSREYNDRVSEDVASADSTGVAGTPSFFINGLRHQGAYEPSTP